MKKKRGPAAGPDPIEIVTELLARLEAREAKHDREGEVAESNIHDLGEAGLFGLNVPSVDGGLGADLGVTTETLRTLAQGAPSTALMLAMHTSTLAHYLLDPGGIPQAQRDFFREQRSWAWGEAVEGKLFAIANSEPGAAGDAHNSKAEISADGTRISGLKTFASIGLAASYFMAAARNVEGVVDFYLVRNDPDHVRQEGSWEAIGMRSSESVTIRFDDAPVVAVLAYPGLLDGPNQRYWATLSFAAILIGIGESLLEEARGVSGGILHQAETVELHLALQASRAFLRHCVDVEPKPADPEYQGLVRDCKVFVSRTLTQRATSLFVAQTGSAYRFSSSFSRKLRDLLAGPLLRPAVGPAFDELWEELGGESER